MKTSFASRILLALACATSLQFASAGTLPPAVQTTPKGDDWTFRVTPYVWLTAVTGDVGIGPVVSHVDASIGDVLENFDMGFMATFEANKGRWGLGLDLIYAQLGTDSSFSGSALSSTSADLQQWFITPRITWTAVKTDRYFMDLLVGGRIFYVDSEVNVYGSHGGAVHASRSKGWIDPIIGIRGRAELGNKFFFNYYGDIGGFGANSDLTWQALAGFGYNLSPSCSIGIGYRAIGMDYNKGGLLMDTVSHGPYIGCEFRF